MVQNDLEISRQIGKVMLASGKKIKCMYYIKQVDEPEFGCEGRPESGPVYGSILMRDKTSERTIKIEEKVLWRSGLDDNMWLGFSMEEGEADTWYAYDEKNDKLILIEKDVLSYIND